MRLVQLEDNGGTSFYVNPRYVTVLRVDDNGDVLIGIEGQDEDYFLSGDIDEIAEKLEE